MLKFIQNSQNTTTDHVKTPFKFQTGIQNHLKTRF